MKTLRHGDYLSLLLTKKLVHFSTHLITSLTFQRPTLTYTHHPTLTFTLHTLVYFHFFFFIMHESNITTFIQLHIPLSSPIKMTGEHPHHVPAREIPPPAPPSPALKTLSSLLLKNMYSF